MNDLISRQAAIDAPEKLIKDCNPDHFVGHQKFIEFMDNAEIGSFGNWQFANGFNLGLTAAEVAIKNLPSAQKKGHWIDGETNFLCSECHRGCWANSDYCPWCGADMRGEQDECNGNLYSNSDHVFFNRRACWGSGREGRKEKIMDDLISRQAAIDAIHEDADWLAVQGSDWQEERMERDKSILMSLPSAQPERCEDCRNFNKARLLIPQPERKKAKWVHGKEIAREYLAGRITYIEYKDYHCSECGYTVEDIRWNVDGELVDRYCTVCGAQMEVEK